VAILIIEDEYLVAEEIKFHLKRAGLPDVEHAATKTAGLAAIARNGWEAAVIDANLNGQGAVEIGAALTGRGIPFVIVTGYDREGLPVPLRNAAVIRKPFQPEELVETVRRLRDSGGG
jgi:DNA-binding response OmpR family regulator